MPFKHQCFKGRGICTSSIAQITGNVPRLLADIVVHKEVRVGVGFISHAEDIVRRSNNNKKWSRMTNITYIDIEKLTYKQKCNTNTQEF